MNISEFLENIDRRVLERGKQYYDSGQILNFSESRPGHWEAEVLGTQTYSLNIELADREVIRTYCSCPYDKGKHCKHVVAVLRKIAAELQGRAYAKETGLKQRSLAAQPYYEQVQSLAGRLEVPQLLEYLLKQGQGNAQIRQDFVLHFGPYLDGDPRQKYGGYIRAIILKINDLKSFPNGLVPELLADQLAPFYQAAKRSVELGFFAEAMYILGMLLDEVEEAIFVSSPDTSVLQSFHQTCMKLLEKVMEGRKGDNFSERAFAFAMQRAGSAAASRMNLKTVFIRMANQHKGN